MPDNLRPDLLELGSGPGPLLASLPAALGRPLAHYDLLLIGVALPGRVILAELSPDEGYEALIYRGVRALEDEGATEAVVIEHSGRYLTERADFPPGALQRAAEVCDQLGITVRDALTVADRPEGRRWRSLGCTDLACCPAEGSPIPETGANPS